MVDLSLMIKFIDPQFAEMEPLNRDRITEVLQICSDLEDMIRDTTQKRKRYPQQVVEGVSNILQSQKEFLVR